MQNIIDKNTQLDQILYLAATEEYEKVSLVYVLFIYLPREHLHFDVLQDSIARAILALELLTVSSHLGVVRSGGSRASVGHRSGLLYKCDFKNQLLFFVKEGRRWHTPGSLYH